MVSIAGFFEVQSSTENKKFLADFESIPTKEFTETLIKSDAERIEELTKQLIEKEVLLGEAIQQIGQMKASYRSLLDRIDNKTDSSNGNVSENEMPKNVAGVSVQDDEGYFNTYSHYEIHHDMLSVSPTKAASARQFNHLFLTG